MKYFLVIAKNSWNCCQQNWQRATYARTSHHSLTTDDRPTPIWYMPDGTYGDSGDFSPLNLYTNNNPIWIRGGKIIANQIGLSPLNFKMFCRPCDFDVSMSLLVTLQIIAQGHNKKWLTLFERRSTKKKTGKVFFDKSSRGYFLNKVKIRFDKSIYLTNFHVFVKSLDL